MFKHHLHYPEKTLVPPLSFSGETKFVALVCTIVKTKPKRLELRICYENGFLKYLTLLIFDFSKAWVSKG